MYNGKHDFSHFDRAIEEGADVAVFDIDNTITRSDIGGLYFYLKKKQFRSKILWTVWILLFSIFRLPIYLLIDKVNRGKCQQLVYKLYLQFDKRTIESGTKEYFEEFLRNRFICYTHDLVFYLKK